MMYQAYLLPHFAKQLARLGRKYRNLKSAIADTLEHFTKEQHQFLGRDLYKVRVSSPDIKRGKSKSFRVIVFVFEYHQALLPIALYFKGEQETITPKEINDHLDMILAEAEAVL